MQNTNNVVSINKNTQSVKFPIYKIEPYYLIDQNRLNSEMTGFWSSDKWDMKNSPLTRHPGNMKGYRYLRFKCENEQLNIELRFSAFTYYTNNLWSPISNHTAAQIHHIGRFLNSMHPKINSLLDYKLEKWELLLYTYLSDNNLPIRRKTTKVNKQQKQIKISRSSRCVEVFRAVYRSLRNEYDTREEYERDVWNLKKLGAIPNPARDDQTLSFTQISPVWLREAVKKVLYNYAVNRSVNTCCGIVVAVTKFGLFIEKKYPGLKPEQIDRKLLLGYIAWLPTTNLTPNIRYSYVSSLRLVLEKSARNEYLPIPEKRLIYPEDMPPRTKRKPRFIPEFVMNQFEPAISKFKDCQFKRMCLVLTEGGMRISELCTLKLDCISQDAEGDYFLLYYQSKMKKEHTIPLSEQTAQVIKDQCQEVLALDIETDYLFPRVKKRHMPYRSGTFSKKLNEFAHDHDIRDENRKLWRFQTHQFRHTVGTRMINNGVPQHIVQKFLGHESSEMTATYAHIHDKTLKEEFQEYRKKRGDLIDIAGNTIERAQPTEADNADLQWFKRNVQAQALPNGYCGLPSVQTECPHANACLTCASFRTDASFLPQHEAQLKQTKQLVQISRDNGWKRQEEMNEKVENNLANIIRKLKKSLTEDSDEEESK